MPVRCPIASSHVMVEIAPALYQCPDCGAGPDFWSIGHLEVEDDMVSGLCATWRPDLGCYTLAVVDWRVDRAGHREGRSLMSSPGGYVSTAAELAAMPLPVRSSGQEPVRLRAAMFPTAVGERIVQTAGRSGRSAGAPSPAAPAADSPRRRRKVGT